MIFERRLIKSYDALAGNEKTVYTILLLSTLLRNLALETKKIEQPISLTVLFALSYS